MALNLSVASALPGLVGNVAGGWMIQRFGGYAEFFLSFTIFPLAALVILPFIRRGQGLSRRDAPPPGP